MAKATAPGGSQVRSGKDPDYVRIDLYGFDIDGYELKPTHRDALLNEAVPLLQMGGSADFYGYTDRSGGSHHNLYVATMRISSVLKFLQKESGCAFSFEKFEPVGEEIAKARGERDGTYNPNFRAASVIVYPYTSSKKKDPTEIGMPRPSVGELIAEEVRKLNTAVGLAGIIFMMTPVGAIMRAVSTPFSILFSLQEGDRLAKRNGTFEGMRDGYEQLVAQYRGVRIKKGGLKAPVPVKVSSKTSGYRRDEREFDAGRREGATAVYNYFASLDQEPITLTNGGKITGRMMLWSAARQHARAGTAAEWWQEKMNEHLAKEGKPTYPFR